MFKPSMAGVYEGAFESINAPGKALRAPGQ
jgi:hypothetical protein